MIQLAYTGMRTRSLHTAAGLTQQQLAEQADLKRTDISKTKRKLMELAKGNLPGKAEIQEEDILGVQDVCQSIGCLAERATG